MREAARRGYFARNRGPHRTIRVPRRGLCIGVVEGACRNVVCGRLKRGGMRWTVDGANAILAPRSCIVSNRFDDFWQRPHRAEATLVPQSRRTPVAGRPSGACSVARSIATGGSPRVHYDAGYSSQAVGHWLYTP